MNKRRIQRRRKRFNVKYVDKNVPQLQFLCLKDKQCIYFDMNVFSFLLYIFWILLNHFGDFGLINKFLLFNNLNIFISLFVFCVLSLKMVNLHHQNQVVIVLVLGHPILFLALVTLMVLIILVLTNVLLNVL